MLNCLRHGSVVSTDRLAQLPIPSQPFNCLQQRFRPSRGTRKPVRPSLREILVAAGHGRHHWQPAMHRLEIDQAERLVQRGQREQIGGGQKLILRLLGHEPAELNLRSAMPSSRA